MRISVATMRISVVAIAMVAGMAASAQEMPRGSPLPKHLPLETPACFGRVYDAAHLKAHPKQRVTSFYLSREFDSDPNAELEPASPQELKSADGQDGRINVTAYVRFRDKRGVYSNGLSCGQSGESGGATCSIDCDGGSFRLTESGGADARFLRLQNNGFVVVGGCGSSEEDQMNTEFVAPGADDKVFRLDAKTVAACKAERDALAPVWAKLGEPLRVRFAKAETTCFTRSYDAKHLASRPKQTVKSIAMQTKKTSDADFHEMTFRVTLKDGGTAQVTNPCSADNYAFSCNPPDSDAAFYLTRAGNDELLLRDRKGVLGQLLKLKLGDDDRAFKLTQAPASACDF